MCLERILDRPGVFRVVLELREEGVYVNVFQTPESDWPEIDHLAPTFRGALYTAKRDYGIEFDEWNVAPDGYWHGVGE